MKKIFIISSLILTLAGVILPCYARNAQQDAHDMWSYSGNYAKVKSLIDKGADVNVTYKSLVTSGACTGKYAEHWGLNFALAHGYYETAKLLIENGADINKVTISQGNTSCDVKMTPFDYAKGNPKMIQLLIDSGLDLDKPLMENDYPPLFYLTSPSDVMVFIKNGANLNVLSRSGHTPMYHRRLDGNFAVYDLLKEYGGKDY